MLNRPASRASLIAACLLLAACDGDAPRPVAAIRQTSSSAMVVDAEHYAAGTLVAALQAIESGRAVVVVSSGSTRGRAAVRQVQQLLLGGAAIDADAVQIRRAANGQMQVTPQPQNPAQASASR